MMKTKKEYLRDGRAPIPLNSITSKVMSANKAKNTKPELALRKALWDSGIRGYRLHLKNIFGRPDISFLKMKFAIFVNGCYWHSCPYCSLSLPKTNTTFWEDKFAKNRERDHRKIEQLKSLGWTTVVIWECQIKKNVEDCVNTVKATINSINKND